MRFRLSAAAAAAMLLASGAQPSAAHIPLDNVLHLVTVVNRSDACAQLHVWHGRTGKPTTPPTKERMLQPGAAYSARVFDHLTDVWVHVLVTGARDCTTPSQSAAILGQNAGRGYVTIVGKSPTYSLVYGHSP